MSEVTLEPKITDVVDPASLRQEVQRKYGAVAADPTREYHFHTGKQLALELGYQKDTLDGLSDDACEAFAGVANPFSWGLPGRGERVVDLGSGAGMDSHIAAMAVGPRGAVVGVDMTREMVERARRLSGDLALPNVEFRLGYIEDLPIDDAWADRVISNGVINLCPDKARVFAEIYRVLKPGGQMTVADICVERPIPEDALKDIDLWTG